MQRRLTAIITLLSGVTFAAPGDAGQSDPGPLAGAPVLEKSTLTVTCHSGLLPDRYDVARFLGGPGSFGIETARDALLRQAHHACNKGYVAVRFMREDEPQLVRLHIGVQAVAERDPH